MKNENVKKLCGINKLLERCMNKSLLKWYGLSGNVADDSCVKRNYDNMVESTRTGSL